MQERVEHRVNPPVMSTNQDKVVESVYNTTAASDRGLRDTLVEVVSTELPEALEDCRSMVCLTAVTEFLVDLLRAICR